MKIDTVYGKGHKKQIGQFVNLYPEIVSRDNFDFRPKNLSPLEVIFSTWGMPVLAHQLIKSPKRKEVFYAASSVKALPYPSKAAGYDL